jgi:hypothetical protein
MSSMKQNDLELVRLGAPSYLLLIDGLAEGNPEDVETLTAAARLYSSYGAAFVSGNDPERARLMSQKARDYAFQAMSLRNKTFAELYDKPFEEFAPVPPSMKKGDEDLLLLVVSTWAAYIEAHKEDWDVLVDLAKIDALTQRLLELDETHYYGFGHLIMGVLKTLAPPALGGKPEEARMHFERAIEISKGNFLQAHVLYAERYARLVYDRPLHDRLLNHVVETPADTVPELTLINTVAKRRASELLAGADDYF